MQSRECEERASARNQYTLWRRSSGRGKFFAFHNHIRDNRLPKPVERLAAALADRYRIESELGEGGMATVYLAEDLKHDRKVALKVLKPDLAAVIGGERFVVEIKTTAALQQRDYQPLRHLLARERTLRNADGESAAHRRFCQQIIMKIVTEDAAPVTRLRKSVPTNISAAIATAVEKPTRPSK